MKLVATLQVTDSPPAGLPLASSGDTSKADHRFSTAAPDRSQSSEVLAKHVNNHSGIKDSQLQHSLSVSDPVHTRTGVLHAASQSESQSGVQANTLLDRDSLGQRHHAQASKLADLQAMTLAGSSPSAPVQNVTIKTEPRSAAVSNVFQRSLAADQDDLLIVIPSSLDRMPMVTASRGWRQGVRTFVAFEQEIDLASAPAVFQV